VRAAGRLGAEDDGKTLMYAGLKEIVPGRIRKIRRVSRSPEKHNLCRQNGALPPLAATLENQ